MEKQYLFKARTNGFYHFRIPILLKTKRAVLAFGEGRLGTGGDWDPSCIVMRRSLDDGRTFEDLRILIESENGHPAHNFVAIAGADGRVHILYCRNYDTCYYMYSDDDCETFSAPTDITYVFDGFSDRYAHKVIATGPGHAIQLSGGRLVVPVWMSTGTGFSGHRPSVVSSIYSDDNGATWQGGDILAERFTNPSETGAVELSDGRVLFNIRNEHREENGRRLVAVSPDGATGWSEPVFDEDLLEPVCLGSILRVPGKDVILFANPHTLDGEHFGQKVHKDRKNLSIKASTDDCKTWNAGRVIDPGISGYSDLAVADNGDILCLYEQGGIDGDQYDNEGLMLARFSLGWVMDA